MSPVTLVTVDGSERELLECSVWGLSNNQGQAMILKVKLPQSRSCHGKVTPWQSRSNYHNQGHMTRSDHDNWGQTTTIKSRHKVTPWQLKSHHGSPCYDMTAATHVMSCATPISLLILWPHMTFTNSLTTCPLFRLTLTAQLNTETAYRHFF